MRISEWPYSRWRRVHLLHAADILTDWSSKAERSLLTVPSILRASGSILSSSPEMKGTTLSRMSILLTPG